MSQALRELGRIAEERDASEQGKARGRFRRRASGGCSGFGQVGGPGGGPQRRGFARFGKGGRDDVPQLG